MEPFARLGAALNEAGVRFVTIGVAGANLWARSGHTIFATRDYDLFLPPDPENALRAWQAADAVGLALFCGDDPLDRPRDRFLPLLRAAGPGRPRHRASLVPLVSSQPCAPGARKLPRSAAYHWRER